MEEHMLTQYSRNWQFFVPHRFGMILLGIIAVVWPVATPGWIPLLFGVYAFANSLFPCAWRMEIAGGRPCRVPVSPQAFERLFSRR
jgi:hypothetical protein